jgi:hypothetical protein
MPITDPSLKRAIHNAVGMTEAEMIKDQAEYIHRFIEAGLAIIAVREKMSGKPPRQFRCSCGNDPS